MQKPKIVFFGSSKFVIPIIEILRKNFELALVITTEKLDTNPIPSYCIKSKVCYYVVTDFRNKQVLQKLTKLNADVGVLASFGTIIPNEVLNLFLHGIINIHPSLLPKYRGPAPVQTATLNGDKTTGVTIIKLDEEVDHGPILTQVETPIFENDTSESLYERLFQLAASSIVRTIELYLKGKIKPKEQNHAKATFTKHLTRTDGYIDILYIERDKSFSTEKLNRMIRAYYPWPSVWTSLRLGYGGQAKLKIIKFLPQKKIQVEGKKPVSYGDFINGYPNLSPVMLNLIQHLNPELSHNYGRK